MDLIYNGLTAGTTPARPPWHCILCWGGIARGIYCGRCLLLDCDRITVGFSTLHVCLFHPGAVYSRTLISVSAWAEYSGSHQRTAPRVRGFSTRPTPIPHSIFKSPHSGHNPTIHFVLLFAHPLCGPTGIHSILQPNKYSAQLTNCRFPCLEMQDSMPCALHTVSPHCREQIQSRQYAEY